MKFDNANSGALFKNDKQGNEKRPDYKGTLNVDGKDYYLSAWLKSSKAGDKYMSLSIQPKDQHREPSVKQLNRPLPEPVNPGFDDSIPF